MSLKRNKISVGGDVGKAWGTRKKGGRVKTMTEESKIMSFPSVEFEKLLAVNYLFSKLHSSLEFSHEKLSRSVFPSSYFIKVSLNSRVIKSLLSSALDSPMICQSGQIIIKKKTSFRSNFKNLSENFEEK